MARPEFKKMEQMTRPEVIEILRQMVNSHVRMKEINRDQGGKVSDEYIDERIYALIYAINSLVVDEKYNLLYEEAINDKEQDNRDI